MGIATPGMANHIYCYAETLPASISQRDYSKFRSMQDVTDYTDSCIRQLQTIENPEENSLKQYVGLCIEIHDMLDQFRDHFNTANYGEAADYTVKAMKAADKLYGKYSEIFANLFAEYLSYDCKGELSNPMINMIGQDMFSPDSTYYPHIRYRLNRKLSVYDNILATIYHNKTKSNREDLKLESTKEALWSSFQLAYNHGKADNKLFNIAMVHYTPLTDDIKSFVNSVESRQNFMDGTGIMLTLYSLSPNKDSLENRLDEIRQRVEILEKCFINISGKGFISKKINGVHLLAYLQAWKDFLKANNAGEKDLAILDSMVSDYLQALPVMPHSYTVANDIFNRLNKPYDFPFEFEKTNQEVNFPTLKYLEDLNAFSKNSDLFMSVETSLPPILENRLNKLIDNKKYMTFLRFCSECLDCIDNYFDNAFTWFIDWSSDKTVEYSKKRREELLAQGWTGKPGDQYIGADHVLDHAVDYIISRKYYHNPSTPVIFSRSAKIKYELGDFNSALLYSQIANELFELKESSTKDWIDNKCVLANSKYIVNNDSSEYISLENLTSKIEEDIIKNPNDDNNDILKKYLLSLYTAIADYKIDKEDIPEAEKLNEKILDEVFLRKDSIWEKGGSIIFTFHEDYIPVKYRSWRIDQLKNNRIKTDSIFNDLQNEIDGLGLFGIPFNIENIVAKVHDIYYRYGENKYNNDFTYIPNRQSEQIRFNIQRYGASMHPTLRNTYYDIVRSEIENYNGILAHGDSIRDAECIYNNLLIFHGLQLLNEQLISSVINHDNEYKKVVEDLASGSFINSENLASLFKSDSYRKKVEEQALTSKNIKDLLNVNYKDVQKNLDWKSVAIEFFKSPFWDDRNNPIPSGEKRWGYYAALLKSNGAPIIIPLCNENDLLKSISNKRFSNKRITDLLWNSIFPYLDNISTIYFVADGELHNIPIEYLPIDKNKTIIDKYNIFRLSSTRMLINNQETSKNMDGTLFGYMHYQPLSLDLTQSDTQDLESARIKEFKTRALHTYINSERGSVEDLPNTKLEISNIANEFRRKKRKCNVFTEYEATENAFKKLSGNAPSILHVATHGIYWSESDLENLSTNIPTLYSNDKTIKENALNRSVLLFSGANSALQGKYKDDEDDGILTGEEVASLDLQNVNMLSLSACQTALGEIKGDGVFGLQRGFKKAGVKSILMSLWNVDDEATNIFMSAFYKYYLDGKTKFQSLRNAINETKKFNPNPKYWAAFILLDGLN